MCHCPADLPDHLRRHGRSEVHVFPPEDALHFRFPPPQNGEEEIEDLDVAHIRFPNQSVNWGRFSDPEDVLYGAPPGWGIATILVQDIPLSIASEGTSVFFFAPMHDPLDCVNGHPICNYAHVEIQVFKENEQKEKINIRKSGGVSRTVKLKYRAMIRDAAKVIKPSKRQAA